MSTQTSRGFLARIWFGFWRLIDGTRRAVFNLLFLGLLIVLLVALFKDGESVSLRNNTTLVLQPAGMVVEEYSMMPFERALNEATGNPQLETRLRDLIRAVELAADDSKISQLLLDVRQLTGIGMASSDELLQAIATFRNSGKKVFGLGGFMDQSQYALASSADELWLEHDGFVWLDGFASYRNYYKDGLDKLKVDINLFRVGEFKSASEPYIRNDMSVADKQARQFLLNDLWQQYLANLARQRGIPISVLDETVNNYSAAVQAAGGDMSQLAVELGLVDRVLSRPEIRSELARSGSSDDKGGFRHIDFLNYLQRRVSPGLHSDKIAVVVIQGEIVSGDAPPSMAGSDTISRRLRAAVNDDAVKAVVLRVNSPGGDAFASEVIRQEMTAIVAAGKPVVVSMGDVAASGGYWVAMGADEIISNSATITGSIGIFGLFPTIQDSLASIGIYTDGVGTAPQAGSLRIDRELSEPIKAQIQTLVEQGYRDFLSLVSEHRNMSVPETDAVAQGRVWTGAQALQRNLVDAQGGLAAATEAAARRAELSDYDVIWIEDELDVWQRWLLGASARSLVAIGVDARLLSGMKLPLLPDSLQQRILQQLRPFLQQQRLPQVLAHCLCLAP